MNTTEKSASNISLLWRRLEDLEQERRFDGDPYPKGMCPFPFRLQGQGFFPGGDGLWREEGELHLESSGQLPRNGIMFIGNDFGTVKSYSKLVSRRFENPPTWKHIKVRIQKAELPVEATFFTNAILGLREEGTALTKKSWQKLPRFSEFCGEFLQYQFAILEPRLVVIMGPDAKDAFDTFAKNKYRGHTLYTGHPYADFGLSIERRVYDIEALRNAWESA